MQRALNRSVRIDGMRQSLVGQGTSGIFGATDAIPMWCLVTAGNDGTGDGPVSLPRTS